VILIDPPRAEGHGRVWSHVASDTSYDELHAFARRLGIPERGFDGDHYDVPAEWYDEVVAAGATPVASRELVARLHRAGLRRRKPRALLPRPTGRGLLRPRRLRAGDLVAVVSPAGPTPPDRLDAGAHVLESWGLRVRVQPSGGSAHSWLADSEDRRTGAFVQAWSDPEVAAVWTARGGFGTQHLLDRLDWPGLAATRPKLVVGFSDATALHQAVAARWGLASLHAPGVAALGEADATAVGAVRSLVMEGGPLVLRGTGWVPGTGDGPVVGGNLTVLASDAGTSHVRPAERSLAFLEDVNEAPYRLDRALTQLARSGWFAGVRGVALGAFTDCGPPAEVESLLRTRLAPLGVPVVARLPVGHVPGNLPLPLGLVARLDGDQGTLTFERTLR
jgi:muramoyltetrapeptide carboxypeptidase